MSGSIVNPPYDLSKPFTVDEKIRIDRSMPPSFRNEMETLQLTQSQAQEMGQSALAPDGRLASTRIAEIRRVQAVYLNGSHAFSQSQTGGNSATLDQYSQQGQQGQQGQVGQPGQQSGQQQSSRPSRPSRQQSEPSVQYPSGAPHYKWGQH